MIRTIGLLFLRGHDMNTEIEHQQIKTNGITLHVAETGPKDGPLLFLLHGYPEFWYGWHNQIDSLVNAGYHVIVPDQRGYNLSDKPRGVSAYNSDQMAADLIGLMDAFGSEKAIIVGHDWGAVVTWWTAIRYPERLNRIVIMNGPHPQVFLKMIRKNPRQMLRSLYFFFFQLPWLPEFLMTRNNGTLMAKLLKISARHGTFSDAEIDAYKRAWSQPGAITAMLNWYRAAFQTQPTRPPANQRVSVPTLVIWGMKDIALVPELAQESIEMCDNGQLVRLEQAGHFVQHEEPERVNDLLREFLT
jgi:epoxide hydrolase 4